MMKRLILLLIFLSTISGLSRANELVLVIGAPGQERFSKAFEKQAAAWQATAKKGGTPAVIFGLAERSDDNQTDLAELVEKLKAMPPDGPPLWIVLIGHGTFDGRTAKFNLRGPDLSADDLEVALRPLKRRVVFINTSASSSPFLQKLSGPNRVIVTATKSAFEKSYAYLGIYIAEAIGSEEADIDNDGGTSLLEAFLFASKQVSEFFEAEGRIASEQALIDDNGDKRGTPAAFFRGIHAVKVSKEGSPDGFRSHQLHFIPPKGEENMTPEMREQRDQLELEVHELRLKKEELAEDAYYRKLEPILLKLSRLYEQLENLDAGKKEEQDKKDPVGEKADAGNNRE